MRACAVLVAFTILAATGCGGGSGGRANSAAGVPPTSNAAATLTLSIRIPRASGAAARHASAVSAATQSVGIKINAGTQQVFNTTATSGYCSTVGPATMCTLPVQAPLGTVTVAVNTYDQPNAAGNILNTGRAGATISSNTTNTVNLTLSSLTVSSLADSGIGTLRSAVAVASSGDVIGFAVSGTIILTSGVIPYTGSNLTLLGPATDGNPVTIDGGNASQILHFSGSGNTINGLNFAHGNLAGAGGAVFSAGSLTVLNSSFSNNVSSDPSGSCSTVSGGGALAVGGDLSISNSTFTSNSDTAPYGLGGALSTYGSVTMSYTTFTNNSATRDAGAWGACGSNLTTPHTISVDHSTFTSNSSSDSGAIGDFAYSQTGTSNLTVTISNSTFSGNSAGSSGAIEIDSDHATISNTLFQNNTSTGDSGVGEVDNQPTAFINDQFINNHANADSGVGEVDDDNTTFTNDTFIGNSAGADSGVAEVDSAATYTNCVFQNNTAVQSGGALEIDTATTITGSTFTGNTSTGTITQRGGAGGAISVFSPLTLINSTVTGNSAVNYGGALYVDYTLTVNGTTINNNSVTGSDPTAAGGGVYLTSNTYTAASITNSTIAANSIANGSGGGIFNAGPNTTITFSTIASNTAGITGGNIDNAYVTTPNISSVGRHPQSARRQEGTRRPQAAASALISLSNSIVSGGSAPSAPDIQNSSTMHGADNNVIFSFNGNAFADSPMNNAIGANPLLGPLQNNGGPTFTMALGSGSPAIGRVPSATCAATPSDQRGHSRTSGTSCDSGAYQTP